MIDWSKTISPGFDEVRLSSSRHDDWFNIEMRVGHDVERIRMTLRSEEAVRDLHYAISRYLARLDLSRRPGAFEVEGSAE